MNNFHEQGRACYKRGEYQKAIELFDRAIGRGASVQLLDNRAACHERLNDLQTALKDAKKAIQLHREDPTGYLRAGRILVKMEKEAVALEIYTHGLRCVKHVGQGYELLRTAQKDLTHNLAAPKSVDPFTLLPRELAEDVLTYLSFKQRMNACMVSKQWALFIRSCPDLWRHLDLSQAQRKVKNAFISRAINIARHKLTKATLSHLYDFDKALAAIVKHCPLEDLTLLQNGFQAGNVKEMLTSATRLKRLILSPMFEFPGSEIVPLVDTLSQRLETFECASKVHDDRSRVILDLQDLNISCPRLRTLSLYHDGSNASHTLPAYCAFGTIPERMPALESVTVRFVNSRGLAPGVVDYRKCAHLRHLDLALFIQHGSMLFLPPTLVSLRLKAIRFTSSNFWFASGPAGSRPVTLFLPCLEELHLDVPGMVIHNVQHLLIDEPVVTDEPEEDAEQTLNPVGSPAKLRKLTIVGARLNYLQISELFKHPRLGALELLHLPRLESCCDDDVGGIMDFLPNLRSLDLSETDITGVGVRRAVESGHLEELVVNNCRKLGIDAVEWAREKGVRVQYRMSDGSNGGRKVRH